MPSSPYSAPPQTQPSPASASASKSKSKPEKAPKTKPAPKPKKPKRSRKSRDDPTSDSAAGDETPRLSTFVLPLAAVLSVFTARLYDMGATVPDIEQAVGESALLGGRVDRGVARRAVWWMTALMGLGVVGVMVGVCLFFGVMASRGDGGQNDDPTGLNLRAFLIA